MEREFLVHVTNRKWRLPLLLASLRMETDSRCPPPPPLPPYITDLLLLPVPPPPALAFSKRGRSLFSMTSSYEEIVFLRSTLDLFLSLVSSSPAPYLRLTVLRVKVLGLDGRVCKGSAIRYIRTL